MAPGVSFDERDAVEDANDVSVDPDGDELAGEEPRDSVPRTGEDDPAVAVDLSQVPVRSQAPVGPHRCYGVLRSLDGVLDRRLGRLHGPQAEPLGWRSARRGTGGVGARCTPRRRRPGPAG